MSKPALRLSSLRNGGNTKTARMKRVSGNAVGRNAKRIVGCENCNFMQLHSMPPKMTNSVSHVAIDPSILQTGRQTRSTGNQTTGNSENPSKPHKTGDVCPRCALPCLRVYDSQAEFGRAQELKILRDKREIFDLEFQRAFVLHAPSSSRTPVPLYKYVSDFTYYLPVKDKEPKLVVEDVKPKGGIVTDVFMMKKKHFEAEYGIDIVIVER